MWITKIIIGVWQDFEVLNFPFIRRKPTIKQQL